MKRFHSVLLGMALSAVTIGLAFAEGRADDAAPFVGDPAKATHVREVFAEWLNSYANADLKGSMAIFDPTVVFAFQGQKDQTYADLEAGYRSEFATRKPGTDKTWVPTIEEIYAEGRTAFVRSVWEARVTSSDGSVKVTARNRSIDVLRLGDDKRWRIFRSLNYPEKDPQK